MKSSIIPDIGNATVILSAELDWRDDCRNGLDHIELRARLARQFEIGELCSIVECRGAYKGVPERSIAITGLGNTVRAIAQREAERFGQESVLHLNYNGEGTLRFTANGHLEPIGDLTIVESIDGLDAWTKVLSTGEIFTFK